MKTQRIMLTQSIILDNIKYLQGIEKFDFVICKDGRLGKQTTDFIKEAIEWLSLEKNSTVEIESVSK